MTRYEYLYTDSDNGRDMEVFRVVTLEARPGVAGIKTTNQWVHVPADKVEEVCAALREAAGLPAVWTVAKNSATDNGMHCAPINDDGSIKPIVDWSVTTRGARMYAACLLAAADEAEARANRPKLPTAEDAVIKVDGRVWVRGDSHWRRTGLISALTDEYMAAADFTVLHDPEASG